MASMNMQGGCVCENAPLYRVGTNNVELASLSAPKPEGMAAANFSTACDGNLPVDPGAAGLTPPDTLTGLFDSRADLVSRSSGPKGSAEGLWARIEPTWASALPRRSMGRRFWSTARGS